MSNSATRKFLVTLIAAASAGLAPFVAHADATPSTKTAATTAKAAVIKLAANEQLAHKVVTGSLGPWARGHVWLTQSSEVDDAPFAGRVVAPDGAIHALPAPDEPESVFLMKVRSVMFRNVDRSPDKELIVLYSAAKIGPQEAPYFSACVYKWNGSSFTRLTDVEARLSGAKTSAEVSRRLANAAAGSRK